MDDHNSRQHTQDPWDAALFSGAAQSMYKTSTPPAPTLEVPLPPRAFEPVALPPAYPVAYSTHAQSLTFAILIMIPLFAAGFYLAQYIGSPATPQNTAALPQVISTSVGE